VTHPSHSNATAQLGDQGSWCSLYDGQRCLGFILNRGKTGYEAYDTDDRSIGLFPSQRDAAAALMEQPR
jgi:hypothetical protein